jgi:adenosylmethionine-8-amino-7-oxononanoate aminotransferase
MLEASLREALEAVVSSSPLARSATVMGGVGRILLTEPVASKIRQNALKVARQDSVDGFHGMLIASTGMAPNVIAVHPPLNISPSLISTMKKLLLRAFQQTEFS